MTDKGGHKLNIADTSAQDIKLEPRDPRRNQLILGGIGVAVIASILFAAPWVMRWAASLTASET